MYVVTAYTSRYSDAIWNRSPPIANVFSMLFQMHPFFLIFYEVEISQAPVNNWKAEVKLKK